jgi:hypothetical protein
MKDDSLRIEFTERFINLSEEDIESYENLKKELPYSYRLVYPRLSDICMPRQIPGKKNHCEIEFYDGSMIIVKGSYNDICNQIDEREKLLDQKLFGDE